jgi:hypothetical protein
MSSIAPNATRPGTLTPTSLRFAAARKPRRTTTGALYGSVTAISHLALPVAGGRVAPDSSGVAAIQARAGVVTRNVSFPADYALAPVFPALGARRNRVDVAPISAGNADLSVLSVFPKKR